MFEFTLPKHGDRIFKAHDRSVFHKLGDLWAYSVSEKEHKKYYDKVHTLIRTSDDILPGDVVHMTCYHYPSRPYYGLAVIYIGADGKKHWDYYADAGLEDIEGASLYNILLEKNPDFFRNASYETLIFINDGDIGNMSVDELNKDTIGDDAKYLIKRAEKHNMSR